MWRKTRSQSDLSRRDALGAVAAMALLTDTSPATREADPHCDLGRAMESVAGNESLCQAVGIGLNPDTAPALWLAARAGCIDVVHDDPPWPIHVGS